MVEKINFYLNQYAVLITIFLIFMLIFDVFIVMPINSDIRLRNNQIESMEKDTKSSRLKNSKLISKKKLLKNKARTLVNSVSNYNNSLEELSFTHFVNEKLKENNIEFKDMRLKRSSQNTIHSKYCFVEFNFHSKLEDILNFLKNIRVSKYFSTTNKISTVFNKNGLISGNIRLNLHMFNEKGSVDEN